VRLTLSADGLQIVVSNHSPYEPAAAGSDAHADVTYDLDDVPGRFEPSSRHSVETVDAKGHCRSCMLTASGGASGVHDRSALVHDATVIVAVGPHLCALRLPALELDWSVEVDAATCFGVCYSAKHDCYVSHGELEIARVALDGKIVWSAGGKDIFSEGFALHDDHVEVVDFNHETYRIALSTGKCSIVE
jgi:hypothetical protein